MTRITVGTLLVLVYVVLLVIPFATGRFRGDWASYSLGLAGFLVVPGLLLTLFGFRARNPLWLPLRRLRSPDGEVRRAAARTLSSLADNPYRRGLLEQVVESLVTALGDTDPRVRADIALAMSAAGRHAVEPLIRALDDPESEVRRNAARALHHMYATRDHMVEYLQRTSRTDAEQVLSTMTTELTVSHTRGDCRCRWETEIVGEEAVQEYLGHLDWTGMDNWRGSYYRCQWTAVHWLVSLDGSRMRCWH